MLTVTADFWQKANFHIFRHHSQSYYKILTQIENKDTNVKDSN